MVDAVAEESDTTVLSGGKLGRRVFRSRRGCIDLEHSTSRSLRAPARGAEGLISPQVLEDMDRQLSAGDREGVLESAYRWIVGLTEEEIDHLRAQPAWPNRLAAAHTVPREIRIPAEKMFDPNQARKVSVPAR